MPSCSMKAASSSRTLGLRAIDPLGFRDSKSYADRLRVLQKNTGQADAFRSFVATSTGCASRSGCSSLSLWAARWAPWSAKRSLACTSVPPASASPRLCCQHRAAPACKKASCR
jgi:hypothetical protein